MNAKLSGDPKLVWAPWQKVEEDFYVSMESDKKGNLVTYGIIVFIVSIGVLNTILMSILERTREFGVLLALGTRPGWLFRLITLETLIMSVLAWTIGSLLSIPVHLYLSRVGIALKEPIDLGGVPYERILGSVSPVVFIEPGLWIVGAAVLVSLWPAYRAGHIQPVKALRST